MDGNNLVVDHVYPVVKGGQNDVFNLVTSCDVCNKEKHSRCLSQDQTLAIWERNKSKDLKNGIIKDYNSLKDIFDKKNSHRIIKP
jgi:5-methylcytosine-specific restriction endonuclease McrA